MKWILPFVLLLAACQKQEVIPSAPAEKSTSVAISPEAAKKCQYRCRLRPA